MIIPRGYPGFQSVTGAFLTLALALVLVPAAARADLHDVAAGVDLAAAIAAANPGDTLRLAPGTHDGPVVIDKSLVFEGSPGAVIDGHGRASVVRVSAPDVTVRGLTLRNSGDDPGTLDSGLHAEKTANGIVVEDNILEGNLFGIVLQGPSDAIARRNRITNRNDAWLGDRGNGIQLWGNKNTRIEDNVITGGRDGILIHTAHGNFIRGNRITDARIAVHYMFANNTEVSGNVSIRNEVGFALMYSEKLKVLRNVSIDDRDHGLMFHTSHKSEVAENVVLRTQEKCTFIYTSARNIIRDNHFEGCGIGIHFTGGSENNKVYGNAFINNRNQVKYLGTIYYEWSLNGRGNYWSDNPAFDLDGDRIADTAYRPNGLVDRVIWMYPLAKLLLSSPALETLRFAQSRFPALYPGGVVDSFPLIQPPPLPVPLPPHTITQVPETKARS